MVYKLNQKDGEILSAVRTRATSAPVVVGDDVFFSRRTDRGGAVCPEESNVAWSQASGGQRASGGSREAVYLDEKVQRGAAQAKEALALDASNGFGGGAGGGEPRRRVGQRRLREREQHAGVPGLTGAAYGRQEL